MKLVRHFPCLFILSCTVHLCRPAFISFLGIDVGNLFAAIGVLLLATFAILGRVWFVDSDHDMLGVQRIVKFLIFWTSAATIYGLARGNSVEAVVKDLLVMIVFCSAMYLGRFERFWRSIENPLWVTLVVLIPLMAVAMFRPAVAIMDDGIVETQLSTEGRIGIETLAYTLTPIYLISPLLFVVCSGQFVSRWKTIAAYSVMFFFLVLNIYFWKRAPVVHVLAFIFYFHYLRSIMTRTIPWGALVSLGAIVFLFASSYFETHTEGFVSRLTETFVEGNIDPRFD
jgi:hypothetical protein